MRSAALCRRLMRRSTCRVSRCVSARSAGCCRHQPPDGSAKDSPAARACLPWPRSLLASPFPSPPSSPPLPPRAPPQPPAAAPPPLSAPAALHARAAGARARAACRPDCARVLSKEVASGRASSHVPYRMFRIGSVWFRAPAAHVWHVLGAATRPPHAPAARTELFPPYTEPANFLVSAG